MPADSNFRWLTGRDDCRSPRCSLAFRTIVPPPLLFRLKENLGKVGTGAAGKGDGGSEEAENEFVRTSKKKFSETQKALDENSYFSKLK